jgi:probable HAF family extracellular repeat protein
MFAMVVFGGMETTFADIAYTFTRINVPGAIDTCAFGINDTGQIVGTFVDSTMANHGFLYSGGSFTTIDVRRATGTFAQGINNRRQIVGWFLDTSGNYHGFVHTCGHSTTIDVPGATLTEPLGSTIAARSWENSKTRLGSMASSLHPQSFLSLGSLPLLAGCLIGLAVVLKRRSVLVLRK